MKLHKLNRFRKCLVFGLLMLIPLTMKTAIVLAQTGDGGIEQALQDFSQMSDKEKQALLSTAGMDYSKGFSLAKVVAWMLFGGIGFIAFVYGKKEESLKPLFIGILLMGYPYFLNNTLGLYLIGSGLCALLYFWRD